MSDQNKTKAQLIKELEDLRQENKALKKAKAALHDSEEKYREMVENANEAIFVAQDEILKFFNFKTLEIIGYSTEELRMVSFVELIHPQDRQMVAERHQLRLKGENLPSVYPFRIVDKNEVVKWVEINSVKIDWEGRPATLNFLMDITQRRQAEESLRESEEKFRNLADQSPNMIFINSKGRVVYVNKACEDLMGYPKEKYLAPDFDFMTIIAPESRELIIKNFKKHTSGEEVAPYEYSLITKDGKKIDAIITSKLIKFQDDFAILGIITDITERIGAEKKLKESLAEKDVLLKEIHHRVKNNMQIISSLLRLQSHTIKDENALDMFKASQSRIKSMALVHESLYKSEDLSRVDFASYISRMTTHLFSIYAPQASHISRDLNVSEMFLDISRAIPCGQIVNELVSNSLKHAFIRKKQGRVAVKMDMDNQGKVTLVVKDDGIGFPQNLNFRKTETLGMQLVNDLVHQLEGTIHLDRKGGTTFKINFLSK